MADSSALLPAARDVVDHHLSPARRVHYSSQGLWEDILDVPRHLWHSPRLCVGPHTLQIVLRCSHPHGLGWAQNDGVGHQSGPAQCWSSGEQEDPEAKGSRDWSRVCQWYGTSSWQIIQPHLHVRHLLLLLQETGTHCQLQEDQISCCSATEEPTCPTFSTHSPGPWRGEHWSCPTILAPWQHCSEWLWVWPEDQFYDLHSFVGLSVPVSHFVAPEKDLDLYQASCTQHVILPTLLYGLVSTIHLEHRTRRLESFLIHNLRVFLGVLVRKKCQTSIHKMAKQQ